MYLPIDMEAHIKFLTAVTSSSLLAWYVEEFQQFELLDTEHQQEPLWELTCRGLNAMVNLKYLLFQALNSLPCAHILRGCTFRLEILRWQNDRDEEQLLEFLTTQPNLRILGVTWTIPTLNTSGICPVLQVLHGNQRAIDAFLPGRSITSLKWSAVLEELRIDAPRYSPPQEFHHLRYFSYGGYLGRPLINVVAPHLPVLEVFELVGLHLIEVCLKFSLLFVPLINHTPRKLDGFQKYPCYGCSSFPAHRPVIGKVCCHSRSTRLISHHYLNSAKISSALTLILKNEYTKDGFEMAVHPAIFPTSTRFFCLIGIYRRHSWAFSLVIVTQVRRYNFPYSNYIRRLGHCSPCFPKN
jgi:hypothetical protein